MDAIFGWCERAAGLPCWCGHLAAHENQARGPQLHADVELTAHGASWLFLEVLERLDALEVCERATTRSQLGYLQGVQMALCVFDGHSTPRRSWRRPSRRHGSSRGPGRRLGPASWPSGHAAAAPGTVGGSNERGSAGRRGLCVIRPRFCKKGRKVLLLLCRFGVGLGMRR